MGVVDYFRSLVSREAAIQRKLDKAKTLLIKNKPLHAEGLLRKGLKADPRNRDMLSTLFHAWILRGDPHKVREYCADFPSSEAKHFQFELDTALAMQRSALRKDTFLKFLQVPASGPGRLPALETIRHNYPKWGRLSLLIVQERLAEGNAQKLSDGLGYLRDSNPEIPLETIKHYYFKRDQLVMQTPKLRHALIESSALRDPERKIKVLQPLADEFMEVALLQYDLGMAYFQNNQPQVAVRYLGRAVGINPYWLNGWIHLGFVSLIADRLVRAREAFVCAKWDRQMRWNHHLVQILNQMLRNFPSLPMFESGIQRYEMKDYPGARDTFLRALSVSPNLLPVRYLLGLSLFKTREFKAAIDPLLEVFASGIFDDNEKEKRRLHFVLERCVHGVTNALVKRGHMQDARMLLDEILMLDPNFEILKEDQKLLQQVYKGSLTRNAFLSYQNAQSAGQKEEALDFLTTALEESPDFVEARVQMALLLAEAGELQKAVAELEGLLEEKEEEKGLQFHLAGLAWQQGDRERAQQVWEGCAQHSSGPWSKLARQNLDSLVSGSGTLQLASLPHCKKSHSLTQESS